MAAPIRPGRSAISGRRPDVHVIAVEGVLDPVVATRLVRLVDARTRLRHVGSASTRHIVLDLSAVEPADASAVETLAPAARTAARHGLGLHLVGFDAVAGHLALPARQLVGRMSRYPTLDTALRAL
ncbi:STAS domain-containing protein [Pseudonocardia kujensis]|uniref:STAS domain-containing protein n=1 Tax=Pseudonocardia kujensis TaxID=1128675 RepID=UPI001E2AF526|nr:STAS domain-containing protein [Pseudonocardia kujensis]MCE0763814.1 STAS domain-containing protein [Pseudonocardia kujensis]